MSPPPAPSLGQLDVTTGIAVAGLLIALLSLGVASLGLYLTVRRDRALGRVGVRIELETEAANYDEPAVLVVRFANSERRTVTVEKAGLSRSKSQGEPFRWRKVRSPVDSRWWIDPLPETIEPGDPTYAIKGTMYMVRAAFFPDAPAWVWATNSNGGVDWAPIPDSIRAAIRATKRHRKAPENEYGQPKTAEIDDDVVIDAADLADH